MPKSRTRKKKGARPSVAPRSRPVTTRRFDVLAPRHQPDWFDRAGERVLDQARRLDRATTPADLEDAVGQLLGAELHWATHSVGIDLRFDDWFVHVLAGAVDRTAGTEDPAERSAMLRLAYGMLSQAPSETLDECRSLYAKIRRQARHADRDVGGDPWLLTPPEVKATGRVWLMFDEPSVRLRYLIELARRGAAEAELYEVEVDACWLPMVAAAGPAGPLDAEPPGRQGEGVVEPRLVEHPDLLGALVNATWDRTVVSGLESEAVLAQRFCMYRRIDALGTALRKQGSQLPGRSRDHGVTMAMMQAQAGFLEDLGAQHGTDRDEEGASLVLSQWTEDSTPGTEWTITEHRVEHHRHLLGDYDQPADLLEILAAWVRFLGERTDADPDLVDRTVAVARGAQRSATACPDVEDRG